ncbi:hypothetical protein ACOI22_03570 [Glaciecola sp. 2405UD65-10]|uniref:hypothetical protein n=1 Tax=Glaciecola sp. 2405UD65-10 TaxID=3397244 RepID=UPI003B598C81
MQNAVSLEVTPEQLNVLDNVFSALSEDDLTRRGFSGDDVKNVYGLIAQVRWTKDVNQLWEFTSNE